MQTGCFRLLHRQREDGPSVEDEILGVTPVHGGVEVRQWIERWKWHLRALCARNLIGPSGDAGVRLGLRLRPLVQRPQQRHRPDQPVLPYEDVRELALREA